MTNEHQSERQRQRWLDRNGQGVHRYRLAVLFCEKFDVSIGEAYRIVTEWMTYKEIKNEVHG